MAFQSNVRIDQTTGIVGEIIYDGPVRAQPGILRTTVETNNVIGRAFTYLDTTANDTVVQAGGSGTAPSTFAGILVNPKVYATSGPTTGTLDPTLQLPNETEVELLSMGIIVVNMLTAAQIGADVYWVPGSGELTTTAGGNVQVPNATVVRQTTTAPGLAIIQLTN